MTKHQKVEKIIIKKLLLWWSTSEFLKIKMFRKKEEKKSDFGGCRVDWWVIEHLSSHGWLDPRGGLHCLWCPNKTWTPPLGTSNTLTIIKKQIRNEKVTTPQSKRGQKLIRSNHWTIQRSIPNTQKKNHCMLLWFYWNSKMICKTSGGILIAL
jgi:hypothetical protein